MKRAGELWKHLGASNSIAGRIGRALLYIVVAVLAYQCVTLRFDWKQQAIVGTLTLLIGLALYTFSQAYVTTLIIVASMLTTCRYAVWRVTRSTKPFRIPAATYAILWVTIERLSVRSSRCRLYTARISG